MYQKHDLHACIVGHSCVRRLQDAVGGAPRILSHRDAAALNAPDWFRVQDHYHRVDFFGQSGYTVIMLQRDITSAGLLYPDVVIIESGSNDLCYRECDIDALVTGLFSYASMLREVHGVRLVIMASVLNRDRCRQVSPAQFRSRAFAFNRKMAARAARTPGVVLWHCVFGAFDQTPNFNFSRIIYYVLCLKNLYAYGVICLRHKLERPCMGMMYISQRNALFVTELCIVQILTNLE